MRCDKPLTFRSFLNTAVTVPADISARDAALVQHRATLLLQGRLRAVWEFFTSLNHIKTKAFGVASVILLQATVWLVAESVFSNSVRGPWVVIALAGCLLALAGLSTLVVAGLKPVRDAQHWATPLSQTTGNECKRALEVVRISPGARELRDAVLARGDELRVFHLLAMLRRALDEVELENAKERDQQDQAVARERMRQCRELHGLPVEGV